MNWINLKWITHLLKLQDGDCMHRSGVNSDRYGDSGLGLFFFFFFFIFLCRFNSEKLSSEGALSKVVQGTMGSLTSIKLFINFICRQTVFIFVFHFLSFSPPCYSQYDFVCQSNVFLATVWKDLISHLQAMGIAHLCLDGGVSCTHLHWQAIPISCKEKGSHGIWNVNIAWYFAYLASAYIHKAMTYEWFFHSKSQCLSIGKHVCQPHIARWITILTEYQVIQP